MSTNPFDDDFDESNFEEDDEERAPLSPSTPTVEYLSRKGGQSDGASTARKRTPRSLATDCAMVHFFCRISPTLLEAVTQNRSVFVCFSGCRTSCKKAVEFRVFYWVPGRMESL